MNVAVQVMPVVPALQSTTMNDDPFVGTPYKAVARLAAGGVGEVFLVEHVTQRQVFAAKLLHAELVGEPRLLQRMRLEAEMLGRLQHANIVAAFDFQCTKDRRPFVVMEYLRGRTIADDLEIRGPMSPEEALEITAQLLSALDAAHGLGIVHRDIKPSNLFLCDAPHGKRQLKVLDFGVARILPDATAFAHSSMAIPTAAGMLVGTPRYLSPEGALGMQLDGRADLYAAALMLYIMLTGRGPFDDVNQESELLAAHIGQQPLPPSQYSQQSLTQELDALVLKGLAKEPSKRYQTAAAFKQAVERHLAELQLPPHVVGQGEDTALRHASEAVKSVPVSKTRRSALNLWIAVFLMVLFGAVMAAVRFTTTSAP